MGGLRRPMVRNAPRFLVAVIQYMHQQLQVINHTHALYIYILYIYTHVYLVSI